MNNSNISIYVVATAIKFEGKVGQWIFTDLNRAGGKYQDIVNGIDDAGEGTDTVTLTGPFNLEQNINNPNLGMVICRHDFDLFRATEEENSESLF